MNAGRNLTVETLQNLAQSRSASVGASVTFTGRHITGGWRMCWGVRQTGGSPMQSPASLRTARWTSRSAVSQN